MERGGTGFQTMVESYRDCEVEKQPGVLIYPGFLDLICGFSTNSIRKTLLIRR